MYPYEPPDYFRFAAFGASARGAHRGPGPFSRGPGAHSGSPGPPFGRAARSGRRSRGDVRAAILLLLADQPMHGYQLIQDLGERTGGVWRPSPGAVYPTLQQLEDEGLVRPAEEGGRRVFTLTEEGWSEAERLRQRPAPWLTADDQVRLHQRASQLAGAVWQASRTGTGAQRDAVAGILDEARRAVYRVLAEPDGPSEAGPVPGAEG